ncbi:hypothetical protein LNP74_32035 [Klebsiella pneumoniae subsp. pneumoniae]|nr:hypothetical protein [Klebsiella pneumoniae subsp. pneumoniae]
MTDIEEQDRSADSRLPAAIWCLRGNFVATRQQSRFCPRGQQSAGCSAALSDWRAGALVDNYRSRVVLNPGVVSLADRSIR